MEGEGEKRDVRRPMNAFLIFCKRHRSMVREKNPDLDNRSVTRILGDLWANLKEEEKCVYTDLAKQYKDAFMKANPDYKWHNPDKAPPSQKMAPPKTGNLKALRSEMDLLPEGSIIPGKLADPSNMGGLSMLLMAGQHNTGTSQDGQFKVPQSREPVPSIKQAEGESEPVTKDTTNQKAAEDAMNKSANQKAVGDAVNKKANQKAVEDAINRTISETALHYSQMFSAQGCLGQSSLSEPNSNVQSSDLSSKTLPSLSGLSVGSDGSDGKPVVLEFTKVLEKSVAYHPDPLRTSANANLLELAKTCSNALGSDKKSVTASAYESERQTATNASHVKSDTKKPAASIYKGMLAEALLDTCNKGHYTGLLHRNNPTETFALSNVPWQGMVESTARTDSSVPNLNIKTEGIGSNPILKTTVPEKSEISRILVTDVKTEEKNESEESALVTCGKMVVNHIIDKLYFSDLATAARKAASDKQEKNTDCPEIKKLQEKHMTLLKSQDVQNGSSLLETVAKTNINDEEMVKFQQNSSDNLKTSKRVSANNFDEHDGNKSQSEGQTKTVAAPNKADRYVSKSLKDKILSRVMREQSLEMAENDAGKNGKVNPKIENTVDKNSDQENKCIAHETAHQTESKTDIKAETKTVTSDTSVVNRKRTISQNSNTSSIEDAETEDRDEYHPIRKSKRRNRGQRYQELINEGIIQPSKERMAAIMHDNKNSSGEVEDFQSIDSHILPETAIRRIRKRTISESDKGRVMSLEEAKRYKTGDFDLEAHIATLPACCIENLSRKRGFARQRHSSDTCPNRKPEDTEKTAIVIDMEKTVSLPPHIKIPTPERSREPVTGSRKRKARKHSITHLLPAPAPSVVVNNKLKGQKCTDEKESNPSQNSDLGQKNDQQRLSETSPLQQTGLDQKCEECEKAKNHSTDVGKNHIHTDIESGKEVVRLSQAGKYMKTCSEWEGRSEIELKIGRQSNSVGKDKNNSSVSSNVSDKSSEKGANLIQANENDNSGSIDLSDNQKMFKTVGDEENKGFSDTEQRKNDNQTVLMSEDQSQTGKKTLNQSEVENMSGISCDILKGGGILYSDDVVLGGRDSQKWDQSDNITESIRTSTEKHSCSPVSGTDEKLNQYAGLQNKENLVQKEAVMSVKDCDVSVKVDLVHTERHWPGDMLKQTLEEGQITADSVNVFVVTESCDRTISSAIGADVKDVNFNSKVQYH